jgi:CO/xanthine dehydrogenase Mo-binding subunit
MKVLQRLSEISRWRKPKLNLPKRRGTISVGEGIAFGDRKIGTGECNVELVLESDGSIRLITSVRDQGVGAHTMHRQVIAEILGVDSDRVQIDVKGTDGPYDTGIQGARGMHVEGQAVARAAVSLREALCRQAASIWKAEVDRVQWEPRRAWLKGTGQLLDLPQLARLCPALRTTGHYKAGRPEFYSFQGVVAEVEVDRETGQVKVTRLGLAYDVGQVINPTIHQGQLDGAVIQGLGFSLMEHLVVEEGRVATASLGDYKIPCIKDVPPFVTSLVRAKEGPGPFGTKSVAESGISVIAPAIANAVYGATGVRITDFPITPEKVLRGLWMENQSKRDQHCSGDG